MAQRIRHGPLETPEQFWARFPPAPNRRACLEWPFARTRNYGTVRYQGRNWLTHRLAWIFTNGPIPEGLNVLHRCDNPPCNNPRHLELGTHQKNIQDAVARGLFPTQKLTAKDIENLQRRRSRGESAAQLARDYNVSPTLIKLRTHR